MKQVAFILFTAVFILSAGSASACNVPVFQYALDRWEPDSYLLLVLHDKPLAEKELELIQAVEQRFQGAEGKGYLNLEVQTVDVNGEIPKPFVKLLESAGLKKFPSVILCYPESYYGIIPVWKGDLGRKNVDLISDSPVRQEVSKRIRSGHSVVWVFLEGGDKKLDDEKKAFLEQELKKNAAEIELPSADELEWDLDAELYEDAEEKEKPEKDKVRPVFSIVSMSRTDEKEMILREILLNSEKDLDEFTNVPIVFPIFGRGRVLFALVGKGINADMIYESSTYLTGACSCQVKAQNPGFDCLIQTDWDNLLVETSEVKEEEPPVLTSVLTGEEDENGVPEPVEKVNPDVPVIEGKNTHGSPILKSMILSGAVLLILIALASAVIFKKTKKD